MYGYYCNASYDNDTLIDSLYELPLFRNIISICDNIGVSSYAAVWGLLEDTQFTENKLGSDPIFMVNLFE